MHVCMYAGTIPYMHVCMYAGTIYAGTIPCVLKNDIHNTVFYSVTN